MGSAGRAADAAPAQRHSYRGFALRAVASAALIAFLVWESGTSAILSLLAHERPACFAAAVACYVIGLAISSYRWQLLAAVVSIRGPSREFLAYYFIGAFTNLFVPGVLGGDAARALYLGRKHGLLGPAAASVVADRSVGLLALFWFAAAAAWLGNSGLLPPAVIRPVILIGVVSLAGFLAAPLIARGEWLMPRRLARYAGLITPYLRHPPTLVPPIVLSLLVQASLVIGQYLLALGLGLSMPFLLFVLCVPIANVFASIPLTLNGLGVREGAYTILFGMAGLGRADAVALGLLWFASSMLGRLVGIFPFLATEAPAWRLPRAGDSRIGRPIP